ncbi:MAG: PEP-CTERM sorting domain-containing protein, partial [Kiritimatiellae bacterium]|nr:PEP-CTERM sorting domain-containing protein [Kiritimatiellia bacterium]
APRSCCRLRMTRIRGGAYHAFPATGNYLRDDTMDMAFQLKGIPEPATGALLAMAGAIVLRRARRRQSS